MSNMDLLLALSPVLGVLAYCVYVFIHSVSCLLWAIITIWISKDNEDEH